MTLEKLKQLEQTTALRILVYLWKENRLWLSKLMLGIEEKDATVVNRGIAKLVELGLMVDKGLPEKGRGMKRWLEITEKGLKVAEKVTEIMELL